MHGGTRFGRHATMALAVLGLAAGALAGSPGVASAAVATIPVSITEWPPGTPPPGTSITFELDWLTPAGGLAKVVATGPLANGAIRTVVPPLPPGLRWGVVLREATEPGPVFRSGPLQALPTGHVPPISVFDGSLSILRESFQSDPLFNPDWHLADRIRAGLAGVAKAGLPEIGLFVSGQSWVVTVETPFYAYRQPFALAPSNDVGHPADVVDALPLGPGAFQATIPFFPVPTRLALQASVRATLGQFLSGYGYFLPTPPFTSTSYSISHVVVAQPDGSLGLRLNGGRVNGPPVVVGPAAGATR
jgi:hypothetical protein